MRGLGPFRDAPAEEARKADLAYLESLSRLYELEEEDLRAGEQWTPQQERALEEQGERYREAQRAFLDLLQ